MGNYFSVLFQEIIICNYLALKKRKNDCKVFQITLVQIFVHQNLKLLHLLLDFVLISIRYHMSIFLNKDIFSFPFFLSFFTKVDILKVVVPVCRLPRIALLAVSY